MALEVPDSQKAKAEDRMDTLGKIVPNWQPVERESLDLAEVISLKDVGQASPLLMLESNPEYYEDLHLVDQAGEQQQPEGDIFAVWVNQILLGELYDNSVKEGDRIGIKYLGQKTSNTTGRDYKSFALTVHVRSENGQVLFREDPQSGSNEAPF